MIGIEKLKYPLRRILGFYPGITRSYLSVYIVCIFLAYLLKMMMVVNLKIFVMFLRIIRCGCAHGTPNVGKDLIRSDGLVLVEIISDGCKVL